MFNLKSRLRAQTALETAFAFSSILFFSFMIMNLGSSFHTRFIANYAAFMAARSYQVYGIGEGKEFFKESLADGKDQELLKDEVPTVIRVAEDIVTCGLPWNKVPDGDAKDSLSFKPPKIPGVVDCMEGRRKYQKTNIDRNIIVFRYDGKNDKNLERIERGFKEPEREPLRYGILRVRYKNPLLINPGGIFNGYTEDPEKPGSGKRIFVTDAVRNRYWLPVFTPLLLNPGLDTGEIKEASGNDGVLEEEK